jgi:WD40 repeat protein
MTQLETWQYQARDGIAAVAISAAGDTIALGVLSKEVICLNRQGQEQWCKPVGNQAWRVGISDDGQTIVAATGSTRFWDMRGRGLYCFDGQGNLHWQKDLQASSWGFSLSSDGNTIAVGTSEKQFLLLDGQGKLLWEEKVPGVGWYAWVWDTAVSHDGQLAVSGAADKRARILDRAGNILATYRAKSEVFAATVSSSGSATAFGDRQGNVYFFDGQGQLLWEDQLTDGIWQVKLTEDGQRLIVGADPKEGHIRVYHRDGRLLWRRHVGGSVTCLAVSQSSQHIAVGTRDGRIFIFDSEGGPIHQAQAQKNIRDIAISARGEMVTAVAMDKIAYGFRLATSPPIPSLETEDVYSHYERGLKRLMASLQNQAAHIEALSFEQQLWENINLTRRYGDTEERRARRNEILDLLNQLTLQEIGRSFNDLLSNND